MHRGRRHWLPPDEQRPLRSIGAAGVPGKGSPPPPPPMVPGSLEANVGSDPHPRSRSSSRSGTTALTRSVWPAGSRFLEHPSRWARSPRPGTGLPDDRSDGRHPTWSRRGTRAWRRLSAGSEAGPVPWSASSRIIVPRSVEPSFPGDEPSRRRSSGRAPSTRCAAYGPCHLSAICQAACLADAIQA